MISDLRLQGFRSYKDESFGFDAGVNIIVGPNASGKTNLLEALLVVCRGSSYRVQDKDLVMHDKPWARLSAQTDTGKRVTKLVATEANTQKSFEINGKIQKRLSHNTTLPVVLFEPNHLQLITGSPERRRDFLDDLLQQTISGYGVLRREYKRILAQRNALLKTGPTARKQLFAWNIRLSETGGKIAALRHQLAEDINQKMPDTYTALAQKQTKVLVNYQSGCPPETYATSLLKKLDASVELDLLRGFTAHGPHRDDMRILLDGHPADEVASRGETRTLMLALKLIELSIAEEKTDRKPILLLDDVFSELDGQRRKALTESLSSYQTFITTTDADVVVQHFIDRCRIIPTKHS